MKMARPLTVGAVAVVLAACAGGESGVQFVPVQAPAWSVPGTALAIVSPSHGQTVRNPVTVEFVTQNFTTGDGRHLHVVVDDGPYLDVTDLDTGAELPTLDPGPHVVRIFPARASHQSVKVNGAFEFVQFHVGEGGGDLPIPPGAPLLTWNLPVGSHAAGDSVLVDFFVRNVTLGQNGHRVRVTVDDGPSQLILAWIPYQIVGLLPGEHTIRMELLDAANRNVAGDFNRIERTITITP